MYNLLPVVSKYFNTLKIDGNSTAVPYVKKFLIIKFCFVFDLVKKESFGLIRNGI